MVVSNNACANLITFNYMVETILVTGVGFIGTNLCLRLLKEGKETICLDNLSTGSLQNLKLLKQFPNFTFINQDITKSINVGFHVDKIYNLACPASPVQYQRIPIETTMTSVVGTYNILELARKYNSKVLHTSTSEIYGNPQIHPQRELYNGCVNPIGIRSCYDEGKRCAESLIF